MIVKKSLKVISPLLLMSILYGCSASTVVPPKKNFSFGAEQAEANRLNTAKIDRENRERKHEERMRDVNAGIRKLEALERLEQAKPDTVVIDRSKSIHIH